MDWIKTRLWDLILIWKLLNTADLQGHWSSKCRHLSSLSIKTHHTGKDRVIDIHRHRGAIQLCDLTLLFSYNQQKSQFKSSEWVYLQHRCQLTEGCFFQWIHTLGSAGHLTCLYVGRSVCVSGAATNKRPAPATTALRAPCVLRGGVTGEDIHCCSTVWLLKNTSRPDPAHAPARPR